MKRNEQMDFARVVAMLSVVMIHVSATYINKDSNYLVANCNLAFILNQVTRFAVPLFILISGTSLELSEGCDKIFYFWQKRMIKIGIPYIAWSTVYYAYNYHSKWEAISVSSYIKTLLLGQGASHLYFIVLIAQMYLVYPFLKKYGHSKSENKVILSFVITYSIQKAFYLLQFNVDLIPPFIRSYLWMLFPTWIFYFVVGSSWAIYLPRIQQFCYKNIVVILYLSKDVLF